MVGNYVPLRKCRLAVRDARLRRSLLSQDECPLSSQTLPLASFQVSLTCCDVSLVSPLSQTGQLHTHRLGAHGPHWYCTSGWTEVAVGFSQAVTNTRASCPLQSSTVQLRRSVQSQA